MMMTYPGFLLSYSNKKARMMQAAAYARVILFKVMDFVRHARIIDVSESAPARLRCAADGDDNVEDEEPRLLPPSSWWYDIFTQLGPFLTSPASLIIENLWLGNALNANDRDFLTRARVRAVVNLSQEVPNLLLPHVTHCQYRARDEVGCALPLRWLVRFIHAQREAGHAVLVHCFIGRSRSVAVVCAYLMAYRGYTFDQAYAHVSRARPAACLNQDLARQLYRAEASGEASTWGAKSSHPRLALPRASSSPPPPPPPH